MRRFRVVLLLVAACAVRAGDVPDDAGGGPGADALARALDAMGIGVADLGYRPKAHWPRYPHPKTVPYVMPFFEDLLANPLDTYEFTRTLGNAVEDLLTPEKLTEPPDAKDRKETLFKLGVVLGTERRMGGFRGYSANLNPRPWKDDPLLHALVTLLERSGTPLRDAPRTFGGAFAADEEDALAKLRAEVAAVPAPLHLPLARFVLNLIEAHEWIDKGLRRVPQEMRDGVFAALPTLAEDTPDGTRYYPVIDDVARLVDEPSLFYGCLKALQATQDARREMEPLVPEDGWEKDWELRLETGWGAVVIDHNPVDVQWVDQPLLIVRCSPHNNLDGPVGATGPRRPLSVALLLGRYGDRVGSSFGDEVTDEPRDRAAVAAGILGCGIVYAAGSRDNYYKTGDWGLGTGLFGLGALVDEGGDDEYRMAAVGMGAGWFGAGLLLDAAGNDEYRLLEGDGQGHGGPGGIGVLADRSGDDTYFCEPDAAKAGRGDYHSADAVAASNAQGAGFGRRGDGSDGHVWAGGLGALLDVDGNDTYRAGNFSQGIGYWYGTGLLWDGGGNDTFESVYFTQGSGAHFAVGALIDEGGNDVHRLGHNAGAAFGFGWDVVNAFLLDRGRGNDVYEAKIISMGLAEVRSNAFLLDEGGDDTYVLDAGTRGLGDVDARPDFTQPRRTAPFTFHIAQVGVFLDCGGKDTYRRRGKDGALSPDPDAKDGATWHVRAREAGARHAPNASFAGDLDAGVLGFLAPWPARGTEAAK